MPMPEDEASWQSLNIMFATASGNVRRNRLSDFTSIMANGKIAMKLDEGDRLIGVATCSENDDVLLAARSGKCIRFRASDVRVFSGRTSTGVRGIRLVGKTDSVISMSILGHNEFDRDRREAYLRLAGARRRAEGESNGGNGNGDEANGNGGSGAEAAARMISEDEYAALAAGEEFILTVTENGFGKRTSNYEYRITNRGGQGIANIETSDRNGPVVASFTVKPADQIMLVTDGGQLIRCPVDDIRIAGRRTQGVTLFTVAEGERVMSVARLDEPGDDENGAALGRGNGAVPPEAHVAENGGADTDE
jgi:DNA gyrase subunit A